VRTRSFATLALLVGFLVSTVAPPTSAAARSPKKLTLVQLGPDGFPRAINNRGDVVGVTIVFNDTAATLWRHGVVVDLGLHEAVDINDRGQVIGLFDDSFLRFGFFWERGVRTTLSLGGESIANAINGRGQVVGASTLALGSGNPFHAYLFHDGSIVDLGALPGHNASSANDINQRGQIVGSSWSESAAGGTLVQRSALWEDGVIVDLGTLGGTLSAAAAINNRGQIVGTSTTAAGQQRAFLWQDGIMMDLGTLEGDEESSAHAINKRGQVIGSSTNAAGERRAFFWDDGVMRAIGTLGGDSTTANAINSHGAVVGHSTTAAGDLRAFVWQDGVLTDLSPDTALSSTASDINDRGEIAGNIDGVPVVWVPHHGGRHKGDRGRILSRPDLLSTLHAD
jgi:probable HAF family extracellular repeat protein